MTHEQRPDSLIEKDAESYKNVSKLLTEIGLDLRDQQKRVIELLEQVIELLKGFV